MELELQRRSIMVVVALLALLSGAIGYWVAPSPDPERELLFVQNGVAVYRFIDNGQPVYFTTPVTAVLPERSEGCASTRTSQLHIKDWR